MYSPDSSTESALIRRVKQTMRDIGTPFTETAGVGCIMPDPLPHRPGLTTEEAGVLWIRLGKTRVIRVTSEPLLCVLLAPRAQQNLRVVGTPHLPIDSFRIDSS